MGNKVRKRGIGDDFETVILESSAGVGPQDIGRAELRSQHETKIEDT